MKAIIIDPRFFTIERREIDLKEINSLLGEQKMTAKVFDNGDILVIGFAATLGSYIFFSLEDKKIPGIGIIFSIEKDEKGKIVSYGDTKTNVEDLRPHWFIDIAPEGFPMPEVKYKTLIHETV
jgi:hypothetical protein